MIPLQVWNFKLYPFATDHAESLRKKFKKTQRLCRRLAVPMPTIMTGVEKNIKK